MKSMPLTFGAKSPYSNTLQQVFGSHLRCQTTPVFCGNTDPVQDTITVDRPTIERLIITNPEEQQKIYNEIRRKEIFSFIPNRAQRLQKSLDSALAVNNIDFRPAILPFLQQAMAEIYGETIPPDISEQLSQARTTSNRDELRQITQSLMVLYSQNTVHKDHLRIEADDIEQLKHIQSDIELYAKLSPILDAIRSNVFQLWSPTADNPYPPLEVFQAGNLLFEMLEPVEFLAYTLPSLRTYALKRYGNPLPPHIEEALRDPKAHLDTLSSIDEEIATMEKEIDWKYKLAFEGQPGYAYVVARNGAGEIIGGGLLSHNEERGFDNKRGHLNTLWVDPVYRGRGIGTQLADKRIELAKEFGFDVLETTPEHPGSLQIYANKGWLYKEEGSGINQDGDEVKAPKLEIPLTLAGHKKVQGHKPFQEVFPEGWNWQAAA